MKHKKLILSLAIVIAVICLNIFVGYILIKSVLGTMFGRKISEDTIIKNFNTNYNSYVQFVETLSKENDITFKKEILSYDIILYKDGKLVKIFDDDEEYKQYKDSVDILQELNINYAVKDNNNVSFSINSMFRLGQYIIYMKNDENFPLNDAIVYKKELHENWYYVELE